MAFLQRVHPIVEEVKMAFFGFDSWICEIICNGVLVPCPEAVVRFVLEVGVHNIVSRTRFSPVLAHTAGSQSSKLIRISRNVLDGLDKISGPPMYVRAHANTVVIVTVKH